MPQTATAIPTNLRFEATTRKGNKVVAASGQRTRNYDWFSGKYFRIIPAGIRLDNYRNNNVFLWAHDSHSIENVLGNADVQMEGAVLVATPTFHMEHDKSMLASALWNKGVLNAVSVRIGLTNEDMANITETDEEILIPTSELWELSLATIPADAGAVRQAALALGINDQQVNSWLMEVKKTMEEELQENGDVAAAEGENLPFFTEEDMVLFTAEMVSNPAALEALQLALVEPVIEENRQLAARVVELESQLAMMAQQPATRLPVNGQPARTTRLSLSASGGAVVNRASQPTTPPPAGIRQAQAMPTGQTSGAKPKAQPHTKAQRVAQRMLERTGKA